MFAAENLTIIIAWLLITVAWVNLSFLMFMWYRRIARRHYFDTKDSARKQYRDIILRFRDQQMDILPVASVLSAARQTAEHDAIVEQLDTPEGYDERTTELLFALGYVEAWARAVFGRKAAPDLVRRALRQEAVEPGDKPPSGWAARLQAMRHASVKRVVALRRLGRLAAPAALVFATRALRDPSPDVRRVAVATLGEKRHPQAIPQLMNELVSALEQGNDVSLRAVKAALVSFRMEDLHHFTPELRHPKKRVRFVVVDSIREIAGHAAKRTLLNKNDFPIEMHRLFVEELVHDSFADVRARAAGVVRHFRDPAAQQALRTLLQDEDEFVRLHAVRACADRYLPDFIPWIAQRIGDTKWRVREAAVLALSAFGRSGEDEMCRYFIRTSDRYASEQVAEELQRDGVVAELVRTFQDPEQSSLASSVFQKLILLEKAAVLLHMVTSDDAPLAARLHLLDLLAADESEESLRAISIIAETETGMVGDKAAAILKRLAAEAANAAAAAPSTASGGMSTEHA